VDGAPEAGLDVDQGASDEAAQMEVIVARRTCHILAAQREVVRAMLEVENGARQVADPHLRISLHPLF